MMLSLRACFTLSLHWSALQCLFEAPLVGEGPAVALSSSAPQQTPAHRPCPEVGENVVIYPDDLFHGERLIVSRHCRPTPELAAPGPVKRLSKAAGNRAGVLRTDPRSRDAV